MSYYGNSLLKSPITFVTFLIIGVGYQISNFFKSGYLVNPILQAIAIIILMAFFFLWVLHLRGKAREDKVITMDEWKCSTFMMISLGTLLVMMVCAYIISTPKPYEESTVFDLCYFEICFMSFTILQYMYQCRILRKTVFKYKEELEFKRMFVRYIAHEVRTPLNTAIMGLQVLEEDLESAIREDQETVQDIKDSCNVAVNVLNELLTFDKLESGNLLLEKSTVNAMSLIKKTVKPFHIQARRSGVALTIRIAPEDFEALSTLSIHVDTNKIAQVVRNLVSNGLKFTPKGGSVEVEVTMCDSEEIVNGVSCKMVKMSVKDSGAGISEENQKRLFKEIVQFNPGKLQKGGGSGLGLYISYGITTLHDGKLGVYSAGEGQGCTFTMLVPAFISTTAEPVPIPSPVDAVPKPTRIGIRTNSNSNRSVGGKSNSRRVHVDVRETYVANQQGPFRRSVDSLVASRSSASSSCYIGSRSSGSILSRHHSVEQHPGATRIPFDGLQVTAYRQTSSPVSDDAVSDFFHDESAPRLSANSSGAPRLSPNEQNFQHMQLIFPDPELKKKRKNEYSGSR